MSKTGRSLDFQRIYDEFVKYYKNPLVADSEYYSWLRDYGCDETKRYGEAIESLMDWGEETIRLVNEDRDAKYYEVLVSLPIKSMNGNVYTQNDLIATSMSMKGRSPSYRHMDRYWFSPRNPANRWGNLEVVDSKYYNGASKAVLRVPKSARCPDTNELLYRMIDGKQIVNVSLEGTNANVFEYGDPPFTLLPKDTLPGIPLARIKPLENIVAEAFQHSQSSIHIEEKSKETSKMVIKPKITDDKIQNIEAEEPTDGINTRTYVDHTDFRGEWGTPVTSDAQIDSQNDNAETSMGGSVPDNYKMTSGKAEQQETVEEPFAGYKDFADCVSKNQDKEDPKAYCGSIKGKTEHAEQQEGAEPKYPDAPMKGPAGDTSQPRLDDHKGPSKSKATSYPAPDVASPPIVKPSIVTGTPPKGAESGVAMGNSPVEGMASLEMRRAKVNADLKAAGAEERALKWEEEYNSLYPEHQRLIGRATQLQADLDKMEADRDEANRQMHNREVERDSWHGKYEHQLALAQEYKNQLELSQQENTRITEKYQKVMAVNLEYTKKLTAAHEEYLDLAKRLENNEEALSRAKNEAKRITRIKA